MRKTQRALLAVLGVLAVTGAGCSGGSGTVADTTPPVEERTFALDLTPTPLRLDFLTAELTELTELSVVERVQRGSGDVVEAPKLRGMLKVKNRSSDRTARLVGGAVEYLDGNGDAIALAPGRVTPRSPSIPIRASVSSLRGRRRSSRPAGSCCRRCTNRWPRRFGSSARAWSAAR